MINLVISVIAMIAILGCDRESKMEPSQSTEEIKPQVSSPSIGTELPRLIPVKAKPDITTKTGSNPLDTSTRTTDKTLSASHEPLNPIAKPLKVELLTSGQDFTCYSDVAHKTTCFGPGLAKNHPLITNAPKEEMLSISGSMHEPMACGLKKADKKLYCWGETTSTRIKDFIDKVKGFTVTELEAVALGQDSACILFNIKGQEICLGSNYFISFPYCTDNISISLKESLLPKLIMYGQSFLTSGLSGLYFSQYKAFTGGMTYSNTNHREMAILSENALIPLWIYHQDSKNIPGKLQFETKDMSKMSQAMKDSIIQLGNTPIIMMAAGENFLCLVKRDDKVLHCMGNKAPSIPANLKVKDLSAGPQHLCVVTVADELKCFWSK